MSDSKVFMFPDNYGRGGGSSDLLPLLAMNGGFGNGNWMWILFLFMMEQWRNGNWGNNGNNGFGTNGTGYLANLANNDTGRELLMQAINGNGNAINQLSTLLNCKFDDVNSVLCSLGGKIQEVGSQVGMGFQQTINAVQAGNTQLGMQIAQCCCDLKTQLSSCCCDIQRDIATTNANLTRGFADVGYALRDQTCNIEKAIDNSTQQILAGQRAAEMREMQDKIDALREKNSQQATFINNAQQTSQVAAMITPIAQELEKIKCKLPETVTLPYSCATAVPTQAVLGGFGWNGFGLNGWNWNNGCCGNSLWG